MACVWLYSQRTGHAAGGGGIRSATQQLGRRLMYGGPLTSLYVQAVLRFKRHALATVAVLVGIHLVCFILMYNSIKVGGLPLASHKS